MWGLGKTDPGFVVLEIASYRSYNQWMWRPLLIMRKWFLLYSSALFIYLFIKMFSWQLGLSLGQASGWCCSKSSKNKLTSCCSFSPSLTNWASVSNFIFLPVRWLYLSDSVTHRGQTGECLWPFSGFVIWVSIREAGKYQNARLLPSEPCKSGESEFNNVLESHSFLEFLELPV